MGDTAVRVEGLGKQYRIGARQATGRCGRASSRRRRPRCGGCGARAGGRGRGGEIVNTGAPRRVIRGEARRGASASSAATAPANRTLLKILSPDHRADDRRSRDARPRRQPAGGRHRLPPRADRPREHLPQRRHPRHDASGDRRKFDEIVAFAEVEQFLDTPVKHYSSGMYMRLAFAVAAHLEPEILIVDEVLAVGDAAFQKKCLGQDGGRVAGRGGRCFSSATTCTAVNSPLQPGAGPS